MFATAIYIGIVTITIFALNLLYKNNKLEASLLLIFIGFIIGAINKITETQEITINGIKTTVTTTNTIESTIILYAFGFIIIIIGIILTYLNLWKNEK